WDRVDAVQRAYLASYHVGQYLYSSMYLRTLPPYSGYNDFSDVDLVRLNKALQDIKATALEHHARMAIFLIPTYIDFLRFQQSGADRVGPVLAKWGQDNRIPVKDLLPEMYARSGRNFPSLFLSCDGHWTPRGSEDAADILQPWLAQLQAEAKTTSVQA